MNKKQIENIVWHIETNRRVAGDKRVLDDVLKSLKNFLKETAQEVPVQEQLVKNIVRKELFEIEKKRYKELKLFYFVNMIMLICLAINSIGSLLQK